MNHRHTSVVAILSATALFTAVPAPACIDAESTPGAEVEVILEASASHDGTAPLEQLEIVFDHVELLDCEGPSPGPLGALPSLIPEAQAAHLPEAPQRLLDASRWIVVDSAQPAPAYQAGTIEPPLRDWCGLRFGFYSALPDTEAIDDGIPEGTSIQGIWQTPDNQPESFSGSIGFDVEHRDVHAPPLKADELRQEPVTVVLQLDFEKVMASIDDADNEASPPSSETIAQGLVDGASITVDGVRLDN